MVHQSQFIEMFGESFSSNETIYLSEMVQEDRPITYGVIKPGDFVEEGVVLVRVKDIVDGKILLTDLRRITSAVAQNYLRSTLSPGDILLSIRGTIGRTAIVTEELDGANITQDTARISLKEEYNNHFIKSVLDSPVIQDWIQLHVKGLAVKGINLEDVRRIPIPTVKNELQEIYITLYHQADKSKFGGCKSQFIEMFGTVNNTRFDTCRIGDLATIKHGYPFDGHYFSEEDNGVMLVTPGNFMIGGGFQEIKCKFFTGSYPEEYVLKAGDLIVTMTDLSKQSDTLGFGALVPFRRDRIYLHNQRIGLFEDVSPLVDRRYLRWCLQTAEYRAYIISSATGSIIKHTSPSRIQDAKVILPPITVNCHRKVNSFAIES